MVENAARYEFVVDRAKELGVTKKDLQNMSVGQVLALSILADALAGKEKVLKEVLDRVDGKVPDVIQGEVIGEVRSALAEVTDDQIKKQLKKLVSGKK